MARRRFTAEQIIMKLREAGEAGPGTDGGTGVEADRGDRADLLWVALRKSCPDARAWLTTALSRPPHYLALSS